MKLLKGIRHVLLIVSAAAIPGIALADPIIVTWDGGESPNPLHTYDMTEFAQTPVPDNGCGPYGDGVYGVDSPISGEVEFRAQGGVDPLCMSVQDPGWWEWDHGNVYTTHVNWVELIMPTQTRAFSFYVGASFVGRGWIEAINAAGDTTRTYFGGRTGIDFGPGDTPGFGVYTEPGSCSAITKIIIEPFEWGTGNFAINQDPCAVPEPKPLTLLGIGLLLLVGFRGTGQLINRARTA